MTVSDHFVAEADDLQLKEVVPLVLFDQAHDDGEDLTVSKCFEKRHLLKSNYVEDQFNCVKSLLAQRYEWHITDLVGMRNTGIGALKDR